jgi:hypothetical protein
MSIGLLHGKHCHRDNHNSLCVPAKAVEMHSVAETLGDYRLNSFGLPAKHRRMAVT